LTNGERSRHPWCSLSPARHASLPQPKLPRPIGVAATIRYQRWCVPLGRPAQQGDGHGTLLRPLRQGFDLWVQPPVGRDEPRTRTPTLPCQPAVDHSPRQWGDEARARLHLLQKNGNEGRVGRSYALGRSSSTASRIFAAPKIAVPATRTSPPCATASAAVLDRIPPST